MFSLQEGYAVERWLERTAASLVAPLTFSYISGGHSNVTLGIVDSRGTRAVLRHPPRGGPFPAGAHDVVREARLVDALAATSLPVAPVLAICEDLSVIGVPFSVSSWVAGHVVATPAEAEQVLISSASRERVTKQLTDALAELHSLDPVTTVGSDRLRTEPYLLRQLRRMSEVWEIVKTREIPAFEDVRDRLTAARPSEVVVGVIHCDYRLGNCMVSGHGQLLAILDWELATVGDVLADVAFLLNNWEAPGDRAPAVWMEQPPTRAGGFPTQKTLLEWYEASTGHDVSSIDYYRAFGWWRMAVIAEGVKRRYEQGSLRRPGVDYGHLSRRVHDLTDRADHHLRLFGG